MLFFLWGGGVGMLDKNGWMMIRQNKTSVWSIFIASVVCLNDSNDYGQSFCVHVYGSENYHNVFITIKGEDRPGTWSILCHENKTSFFPCHFNVV